MAKIALVDESDNLVRVVDEDRVDQTAGTKPGYRWIPTAFATVPDPVPENYIVDTDVQAVVADAWTRTITYRAMTAQEIADREDAIIASETTATTEEALFLAFNAICYLAKNPHNSGLTLAQIKGALENPANQLIDRTAFSVWKKSLRFPE